MKKYRRELLLTTVIMLIPLMVGLFFWNQLPEQIPTHWNTQGVVDGYSSKLFAVVGLPLFLLGIHWFCVFFTTADPKNRKKTTTPIVLVLWLCPILSLVVSYLVYATALEAVVDVNLVISLLIGVLFIVIGFFLPKCQQNYTIGIRIPWTLHSEENWDKTHQFAGTIWKIGGLIILVTSFLKQFGIMMVMTVVIAMIPILYSYYYYQKYEK